MSERTFERFVQNVQDSLGKHAKRKGYAESEDINGAQPAMESRIALRLEPQYCLGEMVSKMREYQCEPKAVLLEKMAGLLFLLWRYEAEIKRQS
jgi:hypothetical protein